VLLFREGFTLEGKSKDPNGERKRKTAEEKSGEIWGVWYMS